MLAEEIMTKGRTWYRVRWRFVAALILVIAGGLATAKFLRIGTWSDVYETVGMASQGDNIALSLLGRQIVAGADIGSVTNGHSPVHAVDTGRFLTLCYHRNGRNVILIAKDRQLLYAALEHYDWVKPLVNKMTKKDDQDSRAEYEVWRDRQLKAIE
jgi:hypothetical protein